MTAARKIALVGLRASGKTSVGRELARRLGLALVDLDDEIAQAFGASKETRASRPTVGEAFAALGEPAFRDLESRTLERVLGDPRALVIATGGGVVERETNRNLIPRCSYVVWLQVPVPELQRRLRADPTPRPPLLGADPVEEVPVIAARREPHFARIAQLALAAWPGTPAEVAERIALHLAGAGLTPRPDAPQREG